MKTSVSVELWECMDILKDQVPSDIGSAITVSSLFIY